MTSAITSEADRSAVADRLAPLLKRRGELLPAADDAHVLSELTNLERQITAVRTGIRPYDLAA